MSIIACRILDNGFEMSSDSQTTYGMTQINGDHLNFAKLFEIRDIVVGGVGHSQDNALMQLFLNTHGIASPDERSILELLGEFSSWKKEKTDNPNIENKYLIGYKGKVFLVAGWLITEINKYYAIGAGMDYALAALYFGAPTAKAVEAAIELNVYCEYPIVTIRKEIK